MGISQIIKDIGKYHYLYVYKVKNTSKIKVKLFASDSKNSVAKKTTTGEIKSNLKRYVNKSIIKFILKKIPKKMLKESILAAVDLFSIKDYFISDDFSLVDCTIAPILWRLPEYGIDLGQNAAAIDNYMDRVFDRPSFRESLSELEQEMRL
jgi:hypothetical protein